MTCIINLIVTLYTLGVRRKGSDDVKYTKGYKFRLYPNKTQAILLNRRDSWEKEKKSVSYNETSSLMTQLKSEGNCLWLKEVDRVALQQSLRDLDAAYQNFFKYGRGYPKYKSRRNRQQCYSDKNSNREIFRVVVCSKGYSRRFATK